MMQRLKQVVLCIVLLVTGLIAQAQCSICSKTASQMGAEAGEGLNAGILYLAAAPLLIIGYISYRFLKNRDQNS